MALKDQIAALPVEDDFPDAFNQVKSPPAIVYPLYTKQWWLDHYGAGTGFRSWHNGTRDRQTMEMQLALPRYLDEKTIKPEDRCVRIVIEAGDTIELPKVWDRAVQTVHNGIICGGLAPRLTRVNAPFVPLDDGLAHLDTGPLESKP
jgi:hypothetical protein